MKKTVFLILAVCMVLTLFAGCNSSTGGNNEPSTPVTTEKPAATNEANQPSGQDEPGEADSGPYNFAAGKFETNEKGFPTAPYDYPLPLTTTDEVITFWTATLIPQYIPEEGFGAIPLNIEVQNKTGVNVEYMITSYEQRSTQMSVMIASDDLPDVMAQGTYYFPGGSQKAIEDGFLANIWDYRDYCPNYFYEVTKDPNDTATYETVFLDSDLVSSFYLLTQRLEVPSLKVIRGDYLEQVGLKSRDLVLWDDWFNALTLIKTQIDKVEFPWPLTSAVDVPGFYSLSPSFDTIGHIGGLPGMYVVDGQVRFGNMNDNDKAYMQKLNEFYSAGLIDPNWASYSNSFAFTSKKDNGEIVMMDMSANSIPAENAINADPNCSWEPLSRPLLYADQTIHLGRNISRVGYGNAQVSASCDNVELAITWCDYRYSADGAFLYNYGPQGDLWDYDSNGEIALSEWTLNHPAGVAWITKLYALGSLIEHGLEDTTRSEKVPGGEVVSEVIDFWTNFNYDGAYEFPIGARLTFDETNYVSTISGDVTTYITENYSLFLDGTKPFSEWEAYVAGVYEVGMQNIIDTYQGAYDRYLASKS